MPHEINLKLTRNFSLKTQVEGYVRVLVRISKNLNALKFKEFQNFPFFFGTVIEQQCGNL